MKAVFENLEAEVDQNEIDLLSGEIERKNLLITNENLIAECLSKDVFYTATDSVLNVSRFFDMHDAFTIAQKQRFGNKKLVTSSDAPSFDSLFVIGKLNEQIQSRGNTIRELKEKISRLTEKNSDADPTLDLKALVSQNKDLTAKLNALHDLNERFRAENAKVKQHYKELYDSIKITRAKTTDQNNSLLSEIENLKAQLKDNSKCVTIPDSKPKVLAPAHGRTVFIRKEQIPLVRCTALKSDCMPADLQETIAPVAYNLTLYRSFYGIWTQASQNIRLGSRRLRDFVKKFIGTVRFGNDHFGAIMGYGDYVIGDSVISRVYYVEGLGHNLFSVGQFCDSDLEVAFRKHTCFVRDLDGVDLTSKNKSWLWHRRLNHLNFGTLNDLARKDLVRGLPRLKFEKDHLCSACQLGKSRKATHKPKTINTIMEVYMGEVFEIQVETPAFVINLLKQLQVGLNKTVRDVRETPQQNGVVERRNCTLVKAARTMLIFFKAPLFLWAEAVVLHVTPKTILIPFSSQQTPYEKCMTGPDLSFPTYIWGSLLPNSESEGILAQIEAKETI
ncbi:integrase, catalytic region, zinc finger, CCHC-type containing protein [Tanacetum coccineum]